MTVSEPDLFILVVVILWVTVHLFLPALFDAFGKKRW